VWLQVPEDGKHIWEAHETISSTRQTGFGVNPILLSEIGWYSRLFHFELEPWEIKALLKIDATARLCWSKKKPTQSAALVKDRVSGGKARVIKG
jgi:hypothetical protein